MGFINIFLSHHLQAKLLNRSVARRANRRGTILGGQTKLICSSIDLGWLANPNGGDVSWLGEIAQSKGYKYDLMHNFWDDTIVAEFKSIVRQVPIPVPIDTLYGGFFPNLSQGWGTNPPPCIWWTSWTITDSNFLVNLGTIKMLADTLRSRNIHWIVVNFPVSPNYKNTIAYGLYGPSWQTAADALQKLRDIETTNQFLHLYDANLDGNHDYSDSEAYDENHLSALGAAKLSTRVDSLIHTILH